MDANSFGLALATYFVECPLSLSFLSLSLGFLTLSFLFSLSLKSETFLLGFILQTYSLSLSLLRFTSRNLFGNLRR
jgi:hypothetical protein